MCKNRESNIFEKGNLREATIHVFTRVNLWLVRKLTATTLEESSVFG